MEFRRIQDPSERPRTAPEGLVEVSSSNVPYIDVREYPPEAARSRIDQYFSDAAPGRKTLVGVAISGPQPSYELATTLAARGIFLVTGDPSESRDALLDQFKSHMRQLAAAASTQPPGNAGFTRAVDINTRPRTESPYAQRPAWFDEAAYRQWLGLLSQPWQEEDAWKSES